MIKFKIIRRHLNREISVKILELLAGALTCLTAGVLFGIFIGMTGRGVNLTFTLGCHNGSGNHSVNGNNEISDKKKEKKK